MKERLVRIMDRNRLTIPKEAFEDLKLTSGDYVLVRWYTDKKLIEIIPTTGLFLRRNKELED